MPTQHLAAAILITDAAGYIEWVNPTFSNITGYSLEEALGRRPGEFLQGAGTDPVVVARMRDALVQGTGFEVEVLNYHKDGAAFWAHLTVDPVTDAAGSIFRFVGVQTRLTGRKHSEQSLRLAISQQMQSALHRISEAAHSAEDLLDLFQRIHEIIGELLPAKNFSVVLYDETIDEMSFPYFIDEFDLPPAPRKLNSGTLSGEVIRSGRALLVTPETQGSLPEEVRESVGSESLDWLGVPLVSQSRVIGALVVQSYSGGTRYREQDKSLLQFVSAQVAAAIERKRQATRIENLAFYDGLTRLPNRALFHECLQRALTIADRRKQKVALLFLDLDRFKEINDSLGHAIGDQALLQVAARLQATKRHGETLARLGGDEFVLIAEDVGQAEAAVIAERMLKALLEPIVVSGHVFSVGGSIGIALYPEDGDTPDDLIRHTDIAMYRAKGAGSGFRFYQSAMGLDLQKRLGMTTRLSAALDAGQLELFYQPHLNLETGGFRGAEALLRWHDGEHGWISPAEFIPIAEERGMMGPLGDWVLAAACRQLKAWLDDGVDFPGRLAVNVSARQLHDPDIAHRLESIVRAAGLSPDKFELELTESSMMVDPEGAVAIMESLSLAGFALAIDDFGTGYSSLSYLKRFPVDRIKIDISFVRDMLSDKDDYAIVKAIIAMADGLGLLTTAEGVEHVEQAEALSALGCHGVQGYYFGYPQPASLFASTWLKSARPDLDLEAVPG